MEQLFYAKVLLIVNNEQEISSYLYSMWGILLNLELRDYKKRFAFDHFWEWLIENSEFDFSKREITAATLSEDGVKINNNL